MTLSLVAAIADNGVIGRAGGLPWHLPDDLKLFKNLTMGGVLIMGRRTFDSIEGQLPGRRCIVLTRHPETQPPGVETATDLNGALQLAADAAEVFVVGGADIYRAALPQADRLHLTHVHADVEGDTVFPHVDFDAWKIVEEVFHSIDARHAHAYTYRRYERRAKSE